MGSLYPLLLCSYELDEDQGFRLGGPHHYVMEKRRQCDLTLASAALLLVTFFCPFSISASFLKVIYGIPGKAWSYSVTKLLGVRGVAKCTDLSSWGFVCQFPSRFSSFLVGPNIIFIISANFKPIWLLTPVFQHELLLSVWFFYRRMICIIFLLILQKHELGKVQLHAEPELNFSDSHWMRF